ncbi:NRDE family protein [Parendozoicomonas haliclonae]|uniref:NRDE family protein n=1 Tax=Parendozoicomonas haliclonae TaxID=1960125 RepID=A0A1X7AG47_9GAMM|nr:NRDE family protein [Parendozoicomonas haliclonae]SMA37861.1 hypothetical protein EHSB41UT_00800 [Parendozoicomonas haliclonae]
MCLIALNWNPNSRFPLVMVANRDEFYQRPAREAHYWEKDPAIFGGIDLQAGGTWLAVSTTGKLATITNYRELDSSGERTRGELTSDFLLSDLSAQNYLLDVHSRRSHYAGFNLLLADNTGLWFYSNREDLIRRLEPGLYGLSNGLLDTPWPKTLQLKQLLENHLASEDPDPETLISLLHDQHQPEDSDLPDTGIGLEWERLLSTCFINSSVYGTRNSTALILDQNQQLHWHEQHYNSDGPVPPVRTETMSMPAHWLSAASLLATL